MKFNKQKLLFLIIVFGFCFLTKAQAGLVDRGNGMIYDEYLDITWLKDANYFQTVGLASAHHTYEEAINLADNLNFGGYDDWRLPQINPVNGTNYVFERTNDGSTFLGSNISGEHSELAHLFNTSIEPLVNNPFFENMIGDFYWVEATPPLDNGIHVAFNTRTGNQELNFSTGQLWLVRSGDVSAVPVPAAVWFMGSGMVALFGLRRRQ